MSFVDFNRLKTHHEVRSYYQQKYENGVRNGVYTPFSWPLGSWGSVLLLLYLLIPFQNRLETRLVRWGLFAAITYLHGYMIFCTKAYTIATGFGIGIIYTWGILWAGALLIFTKPKTEFRRIVRNGIESQIKDERNGQQNDSHVDNSEIRLRTKSSKNTLDVVSSVDNCSQDGSNLSSFTPNGRCVWQPYPLQSLSQRFDWVADLGSNFRGIGWNWKIAGLPSRPLDVQRDLFGASDTTIKDIKTARSGIPRFDNKSDLIRHNLRLAGKSYLVVDLLLTLSHYDPYFWGIFGRPPPSYMPLFMQQSEVLLRIYRLTFTMAAVWQSLQIALALGPLFFVGILGRDRIGVRGEPWFYPDHYGNYSIVFDRGLAGWWGAWWHQMFRSGFDAAGTWLCENLKVDKKSRSGRALQIFTAFTLSACIHGCCSYTLIGETRARNSFLFFFIQSFGLLAELSWKSMLKKVGIHDKIPKRLGQLANFICVHVWFYHTAHLLADDWARGGIWLAQGLPFSIFRGIGMGVPGEGFWCWALRGDTHAWWHNDAKWWKTGFAL